MASEDAAAPALWTERASATLKPAQPARSEAHHGEAVPADALRHAIEEELAWPACVPEYRESVELG